VTHQIGTRPPEGDAFQLTEKAGTYLQALGLKTDLHDFQKNLQLLFAMKSDICSQKQEKTKKLPKCHDSLNLDRARLRSSCLL